MSANQSCACSPGKARKWELALSELLEAHYYATDLKRPEREFAVDLARLAEAGLTNNDLRWLFAKGLVEQTTKFGGAGRRRKRTVRAAAALSFSPRTRVILTQAGLAFAGPVCEAAPGTVPFCGVCGAKGDCPPLPPPGTGSFCAVREAKGACPPPRDADDTPALLPRWDPGTRTLWLGPTLVKQFKVPALNQELVLSVFAEEGWPTSIDDPLPPTTGIQPKRRLHDTIIRLNRGHTCSLIRFHGNGNGLAIHWHRTTAIVKAR